MAFWLITWQFFAQFQKERYPSAQETCSTAPTSLVPTLFRFFDIKTWSFWKNVVLNAAFFEKRRVFF
jgi:cytochrome oxidase assembly protein ShyY1